MVLSKQDLRATMLKQREALPATAMEQAGDAAAQHLISWLEGKEMLTPELRVALYWPMRGEVPVAPLQRQLQALGCMTLLPEVLPGKQDMLFRYWDGTPPLHRDAFGLPCTDEEALAPQLVILPLLAFDGQGHRLGYGAGCYDRALTAMPDALAVGLAYSWQQVKLMPREAHDQPLDAVVTDCGVVEFSQHTAPKA